MHTIFHVLSEFGYGSLAFALITRKDFPSYTKLIEDGHTALIEQFRYASDGVSMTSSHNHHFLGDIARWFTYRIAGLRPVSADTVEIAPDFIESITSARASYSLPAGDIEVSWEKRDGRIFFNVSCDRGVKINLSERLSDAEVSVSYK